MRALLFAVSLLALGLAGCISDPVTDTLPQNQNRFTPGFELPAPIEEPNPSYADAKKTYRDAGTVTDAKALDATAVRDAKTIKKDSLSYIPPGEYK